MPPPNKTPFAIHPREIADHISSRMDKLAYIFVAYKDGDYEHLLDSRLGVPVPSGEPPICTIAYERPAPSSGGESGEPADPCIYFNFGGGWEKICW